MRFRWILLITVVFGLLVGPLVKDIPGFVVIAIGNYTVQTRLWQAIVVVIILLLIFILLYHSVIRVWNSAGHFKNWSGGRRWKRSRLRTIKGMIALSEGDWNNAEKLLTSSVVDTDTPLINLLAAAQAAQAQKEGARRDDYLRQAHLVEPNAEIAIGLTQARLQLDHGQNEQALATLTHLKNIAPKHEHVLLLLQKLYRHLGDWQRFLDLVPELKKVACLPADDLEKFQRIAWESLLARDATKGGIEALNSRWLQIPKAIRKNVELLSCYAELLIQHGGHFEAEKILSSNIRKFQDERLLYLYGKVTGEDAGKQLTFVEGLEKKFIGNAIWLLTAGRLSLNKKLWGKAKAYLEQSLELKPSSETYQQLARAYEALGEIEAAKKCYSEGLEQAIKAKHEL